MDYVKNQKEAIAIVKQMVADGQVAQDIAEKYFPELKESESEDEKIKNQILYAIRQLPICKETKDKCVAWVEDKSVEWDKSDITTLGEIIMTLHTGVFMSSPDRTRQVEWLKRLTPQPKQEWSEGDKVMLDEIIDFFENGTVKLQHDLSLYASWLKSLRDRCTWKPSKGQMKALNTCIMQGEISYVGQGTELQSLYNDLNKLTD